MTTRLEGTGFYQNGKEVKVEVHYCDEPGCNEPANYRKDGKDKCGLHFWGKEYLNWGKRSAIAASPATEQKGQ